MDKLLLISLVLFVACENVSKTDHTTEGSALEEVFIRERQRVVRYDCRGKVTSDKIETINSVSKSFSLNPKTKKNLYDFHAHNKTTDSSAGHVGLLKEGVFTLDLAPTLFNIKANEGLNHIEWNFTYCDSLKQDRTCAVAPVAKESGDLFIHIRQDVVNIEGIQEIRPSADQCKP